jgi:preprotein translocase subunit YajC
MRHHLRPLFAKMLLLSTLAQAQPGAADPTASMMSTFIWFGAIMVIMWVLMIRPQQKRQRELADKIAALKTGDRVITLGGIHGTIANIKDGATLVLKVDDNVKLTIDKSAVATVLSKEA